MDCFNSGQTPWYAVKYTPKVTSLQKVMTKRCERFTVFSSIYPQLNMTKKSYGYSLHVEKHLLDLLISNNGSDRILWVYQKNSPSIGLRATVGPMEGNKYLHFMSKNSFPERVKGSEHSQIKNQFFFVGILNSVRLLAAVAKCKISCLAYC